MSARDRVAAAPPPRRPALSRNVVVLSWVSFFQDLGSEMLYPVLPLFLTGPLGAPASVVGLIEGIAEACSALMKAVSGRLAEGRPTRPWIAAGYGLAAVAKMVIALATSWPAVLGGRVVDRLGKGLRTAPRDTLIASEMPDARGRAFGFHRAADSAGAVVGPLLALGLYEILGRQLRPVLVVAVIPAVISAFLTRLVKERRGAAETPRTKTPALAGASRALTLPGRYWRVVAVVTVFSLFNFPDALLILRAKYLGLGFEAVIGAYALYNLSYSALSYPAGIVSDRLNPRLVFGAGLGVFGVAYLGLGLASQPVWVWLLFAFYGGFTALTDGVGKAWVADLVPAERAGRALGLFHGATGIGVLIASIWAGLAWGSGGRVPLMVSGVAALLLAVALAGGGHFLDRERAAPLP